MSVRVAEVDGRRGHPADDARLVRLLAMKRKRCYAEPPQAAGRGEDILEGCAERDVEREGHRRRPGVPQAEHRVAWRADPDEGGAEVWFAQPRLESDDVAVEADRA